MEVNVTTGAHVGSCPYSREVVCIIVLITISKVDHMPIIFIFMKFAGILEIFHGLLIIFKFIQLIQICIHLFIIGHSIQIIGI